jgi:hypothetical protein
MEDDLMTSYTTDVRMFCKAVDERPKQRAQEQMNFWAGISWTGRILFVVNLQCCLRFPFAAFHRRHCSEVLLN